MADPILAFSQVTLLSEDGRRLIHGLDWQLPRGAKVCLPGAVGEEGTALLRLAVGAIHPQQGQVILDGIALDPDALDHPFLHRGAIGWVPTEGGLLANQTLLDNLILPLQFAQRMNREEAEAAARRALEQAGLAELRGRRPHMLDGQERWLGALARALAMNPELWLIDRPPGRLSPTARQVVATLLTQVADTPTSMLVIGEEDWMPLAVMHAVGWNAGQPVPGDA